MGSKSRIRGRRLDGNCGTRCALVFCKRVEATPILALPGGLPFWHPACAVSRTLSFSTLFQKKSFFCFFQKSLGPRQFWPSPGDSRFGCQHASCPVLFHFLHFFKKCFSCFFQKSRGHANSRFGCAHARKFDEFIFHTGKEGKKEASKQGQTRVGESFSLYTPPPPDRPPLRRPYVDLKELPLTHFSLLFLFVWQ